MGQYDAYLDAYLIDAPRLISHAAFRLSTSGNQEHLTIVHLSCTLSARIKHAITCYTTGHRNSHQIHNSIVHILSYTLSFSRVHAARGLRIAIAYLYRPSATRRSTSPRNSDSSSFPIEISGSLFLSALTASYGGLGWYVFSALLPSQRCLVRVSKAGCK